MLSGLARTACLGEVMIDPSRTCAVLVCGSRLVMVLLIGSMIKTDTRFGDVKLLV